MGMTQSTLFFMGGEGGKFQSTEKYADSRKPQSLLRSLHENYSNEASKMLTISYIHLLI